MVDISDLRVRIHEAIEGDDGWGWRYAYREVEVSDLVEALQAEGVAIEREDHYVSWGKRFPGCPSWRGRRMSDRLREALEWWDEFKGFLWQRLSDNDWAYIDRGFAAARRFLALTETGQQKQAAHLPREQSYVVSVDGPGRYWVVRSDDE